MRVREIKKEDIRVGVIVIDNKGKSWEIKSIQGEYIHFTERTYYSTMDRVLSKFTIAEEEPKTNDTKVMTYTGISTHRLTHNNNYNVKDTGSEYYYELSGDDGKKRLDLKEFFADPAGIREATGTKHDQDKLKPSLLFNDFPHAIEEVLKVLKFGAEKYSEGNWLKVDNGVERYRNAAHRHMLAQEEIDDESGLMHLAHEAASVLMLLELKLGEKIDAE